MTSRHTSKVLAQVVVDQLPPLTNLHRALEELQTFGLCKGDVCLELSHAQSHPCATLTKTWTPEILYYSEVVRPTEVVAHTAPSCPVLPCSPTHCAIAAAFKRASVSMHKDAQEYPSENGRPITSLGVKAEHCDRAILSTLRTYVHLHICM